MCEGIIGATSIDVEVQMGSYRKEYYPDRMLYTGTVGEILLPQHRIRYFGSITALSMSACPIYLYIILPVGSKEIEFLGASMGLPKIPRSYIWLSWFLSPFSHLSHMESLFIFLLVKSTRVGSSRVVASYWISFMLGWSS